MGQAKEGLMAVYKLQGSHIPGAISSGKLISCVQSLAAACVTFLPPLFTSCGD